MNPQHASDLYKFTQQVSIGDSYALAEGAILSGKRWDMIVIDTPQGLHADSKYGLHCEHFDFFRLSLMMLKDRGLLVLYVNKHPYNKDVVGDHGYDLYDCYSYDTWMEKRRVFYGSDTITEDMAIRTYREQINAAGMRLQSVLVVPCFSDVQGLEPYAFRLALSIEKL